MQVRGIPLDSKTGSGEPLTDRIGMAAGGAGFVGQYAEFETKNQRDGRSAGSIFVSDLTSFAGQSLPNPNNVQSRRDEKDQGPFLFLFKSPQICAAVHLNQHQPCFLSLLNGSA